MSASAVRNVIVRFGIAPRLRYFLESFGIRSLDDLPMAEELRKPANAPLAESSVDAESTA